MKRRTQILTPYPHQRYDKDYLISAVNDYIDNTLIPARTTNGQHSLCPFVKTYRDSIEVGVISTNFKESLAAYCESFLKTRPQAMVLAVNMPVSEEDIRIDCERMLNRQGFEEITILTMHPGPDPRMFKKTDLVIVQWEDRLNLARAVLKNQGYFTTK